MRVTADPLTPHTQSYFEADKTSRTSLISGLVCVRRLGAPTGQSLRRKHQERETPEVGQCDFIPCICAA